MRLAAEATSAQTAHALSKSSRTTGGVNNVNNAQQGSVATAASTPGPNATVQTENLEAQTRLANAQTAALGQQTPWWETAINHADQFTSFFGYATLAGSGVALLQRLAKGDVLRRQERQDNAQKRFDRVMELLYDEHAVKRAAAAGRLGKFVAEPTKDTEDLGYARFHEQVFEEVVLILRHRSLDPKNSQLDPFYEKLAPVFLRAYARMAEAAGLEGLVSKAATDGSWDPFYKARAKIDASRIDLSGRHMMGAELRYIYMLGVDFRKAQLGAADFSHADMRRANIAAYCEGAQFIRTRLGDQDERKQAAIFFVPKEGAELLDSIDDDDEKKL